MKYKRKLLFTERLIFGDYNQFDGKISPKMTTNINTWNRYNHNLPSPLSNESVKNCKNPKVENYLMIIIIIKLGNIRVTVTPIVVDTLGTVSK